MAGEKTPTLNGIDLTTAVETMIVQHKRKQEAHRKSGRALRESASDLATLLRMGLVPAGQVETVTALLPKPRGPKPSDS